MNSAIDIQMWPLNRVVEGGRVDRGILSRVEQMWTSDNTDAFDRLRIQESFSYPYVPCVIMSWVTNTPNFVTGRTVPLRYRFHVAMSGSLGIGGDLSHWTAQEMEEAQAFIALYSQIHFTPIINNAPYRMDILAHRSASESAPSRSRCTSRMGGTPKRLLYSRLK